MATNLEYIEFVCEQIRMSGNIRYRKMFGEYMLYLNDKPLFLVCDNTVYVKMFDVLEKIMRNASKGYPYQGAKLQYILDIDDRELCLSVIDTIEPLLKYPKPKKIRVI